MSRTVHPSRIDGTVRAPASKSVMIRVTAAALLAGNDETVIRNPSTSAVALSGLRGAAALGAEVKAVDGAVTIRGGLSPRAEILDCGESGLCIRMFTAIAALCDRELTLTGRNPLLLRPTTSCEGTLGALGAKCSTTGGFPPVRVCGPLDGGEAVVDGAMSSQFLSGLLLALPLVDADSVLHVRNLASRPYVDLTLGLLTSFGVRVEREGYERFVIPGAQSYRVGTHDVEGDWSAAAFLLVLGAVGGRMRVTGLDPRSAQADRRVLEVLERAGASVIHHDDGAEVSRGDLTAFEFDLTDAPDLLPPLAALAAHCEGTSVLRHTDRTIHKESNRVEAVASEFSGLGIRVAVKKDTLEICGGPVSAGSGDAHGDHRVAMALAATACAANGPIEIEGAEHVAKSYPQFFDDLTAAGGDLGEAAPAANGGDA
jgi:3-phosphoshikimate 1-carboxyvinyltransferase